jgi:hypothetical protein
MIIDLFFRFSCSRYGQIWDRVDKFSFPLTSTEEFKEAITEAMDKMYYVMCEAAQKEGGGLHILEVSSLL